MTKEMYKGLNDYLNDILETVVIEINNSTINVTLEIIDKLIYRYESKKTRW